MTGRSLPVNLTAWLRFPWESVDDWSHAPFYGRDAGVLPTKTIYSGD
jgi:hypothetical protein